MGGYIMNFSSPTVVNGAFCSVMAGGNMDQPFIFPNECFGIPITLGIRAKQDLRVVFAGMRSQHVSLEVVIASERLAVRAPAHCADQWSDVYIFQVGL